jgi:nitroreductase
MDCLETIHTRRSVRQFTETDITDSEMETLFRAAMAAPSAGNQQSWRFVVVRDPELRAQLAEATPYSSPVGRAPVGLVVLGDTTAEKHPGYWVQDCSAAVENLLIAAHGVGLGGVWIGVHPVEERERAVAAIVKAPEGFRAFCMVALGRPVSPGPVVDRYDADKIRLNHWS